MMAEGLNIHEIILQLVKTGKQFDESELSRLLPINTVYKGYGLNNGIQKIIFDPPKEYGESYEIEVNPDDDEDRIEKYTQLNQDIQKYNEWFAEQNKKRDAEVFEKLPPNGIVRSDKELGIESKWYPPMQEWETWLFVVSKATPKKFRKSRMIDLMTFKKNEELYKLKENLSVEEFVPRFNHTIYEYMRILIDEAKELDLFDSDHVWYEPNKEFVRRFHNRGMVIDDFEPLFQADFQ